MTDKRLEQLKKEIEVWDGNGYIKITEDFFNNPLNFPSGWCLVQFFEKRISISGWVNQNGEYLTINGKTNFLVSVSFSSGLACFYQKIVDCICSFFPMVAIF